MAINRNDAKIEKRNKTDELKKYISQESFNIETAMKMVRAGADATVANAKGVTLLSLLANSNDKDKDKLYCELAELIGQQAVDYANRLIQKSHTLEIAKLDDVKNQIKDTNKEIEKLEAQLKSLSEASPVNPVSIQNCKDSIQKQIIIKQDLEALINDKWQQLGIGVRDFRKNIEASILNFYSVEPEGLTEYVYNALKHAKKYSLGNCDEFSNIVLHYLIKRGIHAERYYISGGDHVFVVLGRKENSDPNEPLTWGTNAYIIDAWQKKIFKAEEYKTKLWGFIEHKHKLKPENIFVRAIAMIHQPNHHVKMIYLYESKVQIIKSAIQDFISDLNKARMYLEVKYGKDSSDKYKIFNKKILALEELLLKNELFRLRPDYEKVNEKNVVKKYLKFKDMLENNIKKIFDELDRVILFDKNDEKSLMAYNESDSISTQFHKIFDRPPYSLRMYNDAKKTLFENMTKLCKITVPENEELEEFASKIKKIAPK